MKTERNILFAFLLNLFFSIFEFIGGILTGSVAILSDAVHDLGDASSIGLSFFLEKRSKKDPDGSYTYGYLRYSVLGGVITTLILLVGSVAVILGAIHRLIEPTEIHYGGMIIFAIVGVSVNFLAAFLTHEGGSFNQRAVNLHMLEDVLGWGIVLIGAVVMRFTDLALLDPLMSIGVAVFILVHAIKNLHEVSIVFLEKAPHGLDAEELYEHIMEIDGVFDVHHIHLWTIDGAQHCATMHIVTDGDHKTVKDAVRAELGEHGITHTTLELEAIGEDCPARECHPAPAASGHCHHHHHHHH